jgi:hypothetical protein
MANGASFTLSPHTFTFVPVSLPAAVSVRVRATKPGYFDGDLRVSGETLRITSPVQFSPYWMTLIDALPASWQPFFENATDPKIVRAIIKTPTEAEANGWVDERAFP